MKRLSKKQRIKVKQREEVRRIRAKRVSKRLAKARCRARSCPYVVITIPAPEGFDLVSDARSPVLAFLEKLRIAFAAQTTNVVKVDFSRTRRFVAGATLLMYAEIARLREWTQGRVRFRCVPPKNERAKQVLQQIGLLGAAGVKVRRATTFHDVVHWRVAHGSLVDNSICATAIEAFEGQLAPPLVDGFLRGLSEAMTNAIHHAYLDIRSDGLQIQPPRKDWWMFSQLKDDFVTVVFCDLGIGIPVTLPIQKPNLFKRLLSRGREPSDSACIAEAIEDSRTSTNLAGRGRGLGNIVQVVSKFKGGVVYILSNRGCYTYRDGKATTYDFRDSVMGTLIFWRVPLDREDSHGAKSD